jgi:hypothetical protein
MIKPTLPAAEPHSSNRNKRSWLAIQTLFHPPFQKKKSQGDGRFVKYMGLSFPTKSQMHKDIIDYIVYVSTRNSYLGYSHGLTNFAAKFYGSF